ncbi:hypothetical protein pb186bvf_003155 [Paramecium bursaria]
MKNQIAQLMCNKHSNQNVTSINFYENNGDNSRLFCGQCFMELLNQNQKHKSYSLVNIDEVKLVFSNKVMKTDGIKAFSDYTISEGKDISYQLLYQGSRDGFNLKQYYSKCQNQSHLLTIITTKNGNKFGGYSPSQLMNKFGKEADPQLKSFLFQYNKQQIYKLKNSKGADDTESLNCQFGDGDLVFDGIMDSVKILIIHNN